MSQERQPSALKGLIKRKKISFRKKVGKCQLSLFQSIDSLHNAPIVIGFPNLGVTPILVANYLAEQLSLPVIGTITSPLLEASTVLVDSQPIPPIRIMGDSRVVVVTSEMKIPEAIERSLVEAIIEFSKIIGHSTIFCIEGIPVKNLEETQRAVVSFASTSETMVSKLHSLNHKPLSEAVITGPTGQMILRSTLDDCLIDPDLPSRLRDLSLQDPSSEDGDHEEDLPNVTALLVNASSLYPDVSSALVAIRILDSLLEGSLNIDLRKIEVKAATIEDKVRCIMGEASSSDQGYQTMFS